MLIVTGMLLAFVLVVMVGQTARTMQGTGWLPITPAPVDVPYWAGPVVRRLPDVGDARRAGRGLRVRDRLLLRSRRRSRSSGRGAARGRPQRSAPDREHAAV